MRFETFKYLKVSSRVRVDTDGWHQLVHDDVSRVS